MDTLFLLVFAVFTAFTWYAFVVKMRRIEPFSEKIAACNTVAFWSFWLALIAITSVVTDTGDASVALATVIGWSLVAVANLAVLARALLSRLALQCLRDKEEKEKNGTPLSRR